MDNYLENYFEISQPKINENKNLRDPQIFAHASLVNHFIKEGKKEDALLVLPTGVGKTGVISIAPYHISKGRVLIIAPSLIIRDELIKNISPESPNNFLLKTGVFDSYNQLPTVISYEKDLPSTVINSANIVILNIHKLEERLDNSLIKKVDKDFFDLIIIDEAHKSAANTWIETLDYFDNAKVIKLTGTPFRSDGKNIKGELVYFYSLGRAMAKGYIKSLENIEYVPEILKLTIDDNIDKEYTVDEIYSLGLRDSDWVTRSVAYSKDCSKSIVDASIKLLEEKKESSVIPHKIIAVACSISHAKQIKELYEEAGKKVSIVHSELDEKELDIEYKKIENNRVDVVVNVAMLGEGYDHPYLSIAAIFRPFRHELPYIQFIGRILRYITDEDAKAKDNIGHIIVHKNLELDNLWEKYKKEIEKGKIIKDLLTDENVIYLNPDSGKVEKPSDIDIGRATEEGVPEYQKDIYMETEIIRQAHLDAENEDKKLISELIERYNINKDTAKLIARQMNVEKGSLRPDLEYRLTKKGFDSNLHEVVIPDVLIHFNLEPKGSELKTLPILQKGKYSYISRKNSDNAGMLAQLFNKYLKDELGARNTWDDNEIYRRGYDLLDRMVEYICSMEIEEGL